MAQPNFIDTASTYPENLGQHNFWNCNLPDYRQRLEEKSEDLFGDEVTAQLEFLQLNGAISEFEWEKARTDSGLLRLLSDYAAKNDLPKCQHFFIRARNSKTKLRVTGSMTRVLLSHHKVMPMFLEFLFPFRKQKHKKNFDFSGFRAIESWVDRTWNSQSATQALLSCQIQLCYNLRCVENTSKPPEWPWSMRQTAVYHSFDLHNGDAVWINLKGNTDLSPRIQNLVRKSAPSDPASMSDTPGAFRAALATHLVYCEWASENWAAYVGFLEDQLQDKTWYALVADIPPARRTENRINAIDRRRTEPQPFVRQSTMASIARASKRVSKLWNAGSPAQALATQAPIPEDTEMTTRRTTREDDGEGDDFTYDDLRGIQHIEDQANITVLAIRSNINIISELLGYYGTLQKSEEFQIALGHGCDPALRRFVARINSTLSDLRLHQSRVETLLQLLADRKALLLQLFAHRNMSTSKDLTIRAQESAEKMETLTAHMKHIALKTEKETIFMRIITVVTLFFLPGTFVATLMSTDIMKFQNDNDVISRFSWQALLMYFGITIPIMAFTVWAAFRYRRREQDKLKQKRAEAEKADLELGLSIDA